jgi:hypothetical protein
MRDEDARGCKGGLKGNKDEDWLVCKGGLKGNKDEDWLVCKGGMDLGHAAVLGGFCICDTRWVFRINCSAGILPVTGVWHFRGRFILL